jgi:hypothetical protein
MKPEKQNLIHDLLGEHSSREATLLAGAQILRRRRQWRTVRHGSAVLALLVAAIVLSLRKETPAPSLTTAQTTKTAPVSQVHEINDDELLALFPNTPVALASLPDGKKLLLFPRPGDARRFVKRL